MEFGETIGHSARIVYITQLGLSENMENHGEKYG